jgi:hypothetical protein
MFERLSFLVGFGLFVTDVGGMEDDDIDDDIVDDIDDDIVGRIE